MYVRKTLAFLRGMWYHQVVFGRVPLLGMGSGGAKSRLLQLRGYSTVGSAIRSQRIGCGAREGEARSSTEGTPFRGVGGISLSAARRQIAWGYSTVGSAIRSQRIGHEFESRYLHQSKPKTNHCQVKVVLGFFFSLFSFLRFIFKASKILSIINKYGA